MRHARQLWCAALTAASVFGATGASAAGNPADTLAILAYVMSRPETNSPSSTGPGAAVIPGSAALPPPPTIATAPQLVAGQFRANELLVVLQPGATAEIANALARDYGLQLEIFTPSRLLRTAVVRFQIPDGRPVASVLAALLRDQRVRASQPNYVYHPAASASQVPQGIAQYGLDIIHAAAAMAKVGSAARTPVVAVIDTGIDESHPGLAGSVRSRFDAMADGHWDYSAHGTAIAGLIAAHGQVLGVDPQAAILSVRVFPAQAAQEAAEATSLALLRGLDWSVGEHADVVNMSLAGPPDPLVGAAIEVAMKAGAVVVAAAGNDGPDGPPDYPAAIAGVIAVTATDGQDRLLGAANRGSYVSVAAPGVDVICLAPGGGVVLATGTSQAAAEVSGLVAILRSIRPGLTPPQALEVLTRTAKDLGAPGRDDLFGAGRIDAAAAVEGLTALPAVGQ